MNRTLFEAIGDIDSKLIEDCENEIIPARSAPWKMWVASAACLALIAACTLSLARRQNGSVIDPSSTESGNDASRESGASQKSASSLLYTELPFFYSNPITINGNEISFPVSTPAVSFALWTEDYVAMNDSEFQEYFGLSLKIEDIIPGMQSYDPLKDELWAHGIYQNSTRGIYCDFHQFIYTNADFSKSLTVAAGRTAYPSLPYPSQLRSSPSQAYVQSEINGVGVTVFSYTNADGILFYCAEYSTDENYFLIHAGGLSANEFTSVLSSLLEDYRGLHTETGKDAMHTITGIFTLLDPTAGIGGIALSDGSTLCFELNSLNFSTEELEKRIGDSFTIQYKGEPFSAKTLWTEQIERVTIGENTK